MEITTFLIFIMLEVFLAVLGVWRKGVLFSLIGLVCAIFMLPLSLNNVVVSRAYTTNPLDGNITTHLVYADNTLIVMVFFIIFMFHFIVIIRCFK